MSEGVQFVDELRVPNLRGFECVSLIEKLLKEWWFSTKCAAIETERNEMGLEIWNWLGKREMDLTEEKKLIDTERVV